MAFDTIKGYSEKEELFHHFYRALYIPAEDDENQKTWIKKCS
jgi:hypothetical protein